MRVLVVEDEVGLADLLREGLSFEGFAIDVVHTGVDGLWAATQHPYDVIVLDIMLPQLSGYEVCRQLRQRRIWTPVLMLTAKDGEYDEADALDLGRRRLPDQTVLVRGSGGADPGADPSRRADTAHGAVGR
jgi:DNA-binding response OmpR family regulator